MMVQVQPTAHGVAKKATPEEIAKEESIYRLAADTGLVLIADNGDILTPNSGDMGFTNPNLHRRIDLEREAPDIPEAYRRLMYETELMDAKYDPDYILTEDDQELIVPRFDTRAQMEAEGGVPIDPYLQYAFVRYDEDGKPYKQTVTLGVWDGLHSYRTTETFIHDEESTTCEIP